MTIIISNASQDPIYKQITKQIKNLILNGELEPEKILPSIRRLAKELMKSLKRKVLLKPLQEKDPLWLIRIKSF
jgi:DNA-binding transcriptional regulator YhcF (GntR family)